MSEYKYTLTGGASPLVADKDASGWEEQGITWGRNQRYHGVNQTPSANLRWYENSNVYDYVVNLRETDGVFANIGLHIEKKNRATDTFETWGNFIFDFATSPGEFEINYDKKFVEFKLITTSDEQKFYMRDEIERNLRDLVSDDGDSLTAFSSEPDSATFLPLDIFLESDLEINASGGSGGEYYFDTVDTRINASENRLNIDGSKQIYENSTEFEAVTEMTLEGEIEWSIITTASTSVNSVLSTIEMILDKTIGGITTSQVLYTNSYTESNVPTGDFGFTYNETVPTVTVSDSLLPENIYELYIRVTLSVTNLSAIVNSMDATLDPFEFTEEFEGVAATACDGYKVHEALSRSMAQSTGNINLYAPIFGTATSQYQSYASDGKWNRLFISSIKNVRQFPSASIITSFAQLFETLDAGIGIGMWYNPTESRFEIYERDKFYEDRQVATINNVTKLRKRPFDEAFFNDIASGNQNYSDYEEIGYANTIITPATHFVAVPNQNKADYQGKLHLDPIPMELARKRLYKNYSSTPTKYDDFTVMVQLDSSGQTLQAGGSFSGFRGIDQMYNPEFTARQCLLRHPEIISQLEGDTSQTIQFKSNRRDIDFDYTVFFGVTKSESDNIPQNELIYDTSTLPPTTTVYSDLRYYDPWIYEFEFVLTSELVDVFNTDPHGYFNIVFESESYYGYLYQVDGADYNRKATGVFIKARRNR